MPYIPHKWNLKWNIALLNNPINTNKLQIAFQMVKINCDYYKSTYSTYKPFYMVLSQINTKEEV